MLCKTAGAVTADCVGGNRSSGRGDEEEEEDEDEDEDEEAAGAVAQAGAEADATASHPGCSVAESLAINKSPTEPTEPTELSETCLCNAVAETAAVATAEVEDTPPLPASSLWCSWRICSKSTMVSSTIP